MAEFPDELHKLADIATDPDFTPKLRIDAIDQLGNIGTHEALLVLLNLAANERLAPKERDIALKQARRIVRSGH